MCKWGGGNGAVRIRALADELRFGGELGTQLLHMAEDAALMAQLTMADVLGLEVGQGGCLFVAHSSHDAAGLPARRSCQGLAWLGEQLTADIRRAVSCIRREYSVKLSWTEFQGRLLNDHELQMIAMNLLTGGIGMTSYFMGSVERFLAEIATIVAKKNPSRTAA